MRHVFFCFVAAWQWRLLWVGSRREFNMFRSSITKDELDEHVRSRMLVDVHSNTTRCNAVRARTLLSTLSKDGDFSVNVHVLTSDWHVPRGMLLFSRYFGVGTTAEARVRPSWPVVGVPCRT